MPDPIDFTQLPRIHVGTMNFGKRTPAPEAERIIARSIERGLTFFDTANVYNDGESERILGKAVKSRRESVQIATKVGFGRVNGKPEGLSKAAISAAIDQSLERLGTDYVDVYYFHVPDRVVPIEESLDAMHALLNAKKARAWGVSNFASWQILEINHLADARGMPRPAIAQQMYNVLIRQLEVEYFAFARKYKIHTTVYNPLAGGLLSGKHTRDQSSIKGSRFDKNTLYQKRYWSDRMFDRIDALKAIADSEKLSLVDLAYDWIHGRSGVDSILIGPGSVDHVDAAIDGAAKPLSENARAAIDELHQASQGSDASYAR